MLASRGAIIPALSASGLDQQATERAWRGAAVGAWQANEMLKGLHEQVIAEQQWEALKIGGRSVKAYDTVGFFRPRLVCGAGKHYDSQAGKALPAIPFGILGAVGKVNEQPVTLPLSIVRGLTRSQPVGGTSIQNRLPVACAAHYPKLLCPISPTQPNFKKRIPKPTSCPRVFTLHWPRLA